MTCVWDSIIQSLTYEERNFIFESRRKRACVFQKKTIPVYSRARVANIPAATCTK